MFKKKFTLGFIILIAFSLFPLYGNGLRVSKTCRYLEYENGTPFLYLGDTAWELFHRLNREEADLYLQNRAEKGFTVIQAVVLAENDGLRVPNSYGHLPFKNLDPTRPNEKYFEHVDYIVNQAEKLGLFIGMLPTWGDKVTNFNGGAGPQVFTPENAKTYGHYLAERYQNKPIIWILGGDRNIENDVELKIWQNMAEGIREVVGEKQLISYHPRGAQLSSTWLHNESWLDFNMYQSGHVGRFSPVYQFAETLNQLVSRKPFVDGEPGYEDIAVKFWEFCDWSNPLRVPESVLDENRIIKDKSYFKKGFIDAYDVRVAGYWNFLSGACGYTYGNNAIWQMFKKGGPIAIPCLTDWNDAMDRPGAWDIQPMRKVFESRSIAKLVPDQSIIYGYNYKDEHHLRAAGSSDGSFVLVYAAQGQPFTVVMSKIKNEKVVGHWFNPRNGEVIYIGSFKNEGHKTYTPPSSGIGHDWLLILDDASANLPLPGRVSQSLNLYSPDNHINVSIQFIDKSLFYQVKMNGCNDVIESSQLGIVRNDQEFVQNLKFDGFERKIIDEEYELIAGKQKVNQFEANQYVLNFMNEKKNPIQIIFQVFNDGVAFKYYFPNKNDETFVIKNELSQFNLPDDGLAWMLPYDTVGVWSPAYEAVFEKEIAVGSPAPSTTGWCFPALFHVNDHWVLLTESNVDRNYCGSHLAAKSPEGKYKIEFPLETESYGLGSKYPQSTLPWSTPWRVIITGKNLSTIVESNIVQHLADPCEVENLTWIKPGRCSWSWWGDHSSARSYKTLKSYVDLSAKMGWEYSLVDAEWDYMEGGSLEQLAQYAQSQNVRLFVWYNSGGPHNKAKALYLLTDEVYEKVSKSKLFGSRELEPLKGMIQKYYFDDVPYIQDIEKLLHNELSENQKSYLLKATFVPNATPRDKMHIKDIRRKEFKKLHKMGIAGVKIDFFNSDKQDIMKLYLDIAEDAAEFNILVNTHGCTLPRGWQRTYPNYISMEGVRGAELYGVNTFPERAVWLNALYPFTRNVVGPMDYTPVTFSDYVPENAHLTTNGHELALSIIFECGVQHLADRKASYEAQPDYVQAFLSELPVVWDDTYLLDGYPAKSVLMARENEGNFYLAGINGEMDPKTFTADLSFLPEGEYVMQVITDDQPRTWKTFKTSVNNSDVFEIDVLPAGGFVGVVEKK